jgi:thymidylate synthase (FAD)
MFHEIKLLDHGYIKVVESYGSEQSIIEAARMSTGKGFLGWGPTEICPTCKTYVSSRPAKLVCGCGFDGDTETKSGDEKLLRFLYENHHATPFEMAGLIIEVKAPIFVFREWHRHRVPFSYNEMSARYTPLPDENYIPSIERLLVNSKANKQAGTVKGAAILDDNGAILFRALLEEKYMGCEVLYQNALESGVPKELARLVLPVGRYSRMRASSNLRGWLNFLALRSDVNPGAQWEIREYGNALEKLLSEIFPRTMQLFQELRRAP